MNNKEEQITSLIELNDELENYFRNTIIPQLFIDSQLILRKFTPPAMKQFNLAKDDIGKRIDDIKDNFRFPTIIDNVKEVIDTGEILEKEIQTTDMRWYQMNILPYIIQKENKANGVIITFVEITMRIRDLKEQEKLIADHEILLDTISHDIKTPLTSLGLTINIFKKLPEKGMDKFPFLLEKIENSVIKMQHVIDDLTDSRQKEYRYKAVEELLNFEHILEDVRLTLAQQIFESGAIIKSEINASEIVYARRKLRSIVYNLVNNAIKYKSETRRPEIFIRTEKSDEYIIISVSDNGVGIAEKDLDTIFSKYERIETSVEGTGLGLYLVKETVNYSGGKIIVESRLGIGSTFKVFLRI